MSNSLICLIRNEPVEAQPEEVVRQKLIKQMIEGLGYPKQNLAVEKALRHLPHLSNRGVQIPDRRADIICFAKGIHPEYGLYPLLIVECKVDKITSKVKNQVIGYNHYVRSPFIAVANENEVQTGWFDPDSKSYRFIDYLPGFSDLLQSLS